MHKTFIAGTGTGIGKTLASAVLAETLGADYWKPIQAGNLADSDSMEVARLTSGNINIHPETYKLQTPASPHDAAKKDGKAISLEAFKIPETTKNELLIEGAGGLMVPLNNQSLVIDLIPKLADSVILVSQNYLGSINHTLLSIEALKNRKIPIEGLIINGRHYPEGEDWILNYAQTPKIGHLNPENFFDHSVIQRYAGKWRSKIKRS